MEHSAIWCFVEGKKRGGFTEPVLSYNRQLLNSFSLNAILISYGDIIIILLWCLQTIEKLRTDITIMDANLYNTIWYPTYLKKKKTLKISFSNTAIDTRGYLKWNPQKIEIKNVTNKAEKLIWILYQLILTIIY